MHDKHGQAIHIADRVETADGKKFHVAGAILDDGTVIHGERAGKSKVTAFAHEVSIIEKHPANKGRKDLGGGCIVWGNGKQDPDPPV